AKAKAADPSLPTDLRWEAMEPLFRPDYSGAPGDLDLSDVLKKEGKTPPRHPTSELVGPGKVFITANDLDQITSAVSFATDHHLRIVIVGGRDSALCADLLRQHDIPVIILGTLRMPRRDD